MKSYRSLTVADLIALLDGMEPTAALPGLSADADSYRGYYEHVAIRPGRGTTAGELSAHLKSRIGDTMTGYKGGEFEFKDSCYVFVAGYGDTGPALAGFAENAEPIGFEQGWY